jgi:hypothetical protein
VAQPSARERQEKGGGVGVGVCEGVRELLLEAEGLPVLDGLTDVDAAGVLEAGAVGVKRMLLVAEGLSVLDGLTVVDAAGVLEAGALALEGPLTDAKAVLDDIAVADEEGRAEAVLDDVAVADEEGRAEGLAQRRILMTLNHISGM